MKQKKIGLLTLPLTDNYGGIIQLTALNTYLRSEGYDVYHLNKRYDITVIKQFARKLLKWNPFYSIYDFNNHAIKHRYIKKLNDFITTEITETTKDIYSSSKLTQKVYELELDAVIVGSDQVWRMQYIKENYEDYFLGFLDSNKVSKIAYAASFGTDLWENKNNISSVENLLRDFTSISVREDSGVFICNNTFNITKVEHVLDPTFLPNLTYYETIINREYKLKKDVGLFNYVLDKSPIKAEIIGNIAEQLNLKIDAIYLENNLKDYSNKKRLKPSVGEWLYHFKNAKFVVTDSFHGTVFSIIFNKQFIAIGNSTRGITRFTSLLKSLDLSNRFILDDNELYISVIKQTIDYDLVNRKLKQLKLRSIEFLKNALS
ncbi:polysaccharide pyruvyl transferase family protein [Maribacter luteus]|uniref:polysaccharide pyruvyl transferase family protein n=1 Tax=Maribacter luteus TaxID=2594478 RepID=UPI00249168C3|nr:polysaccharide pyruvyl transferase family protein [Maribacter luteus]